MSSCPSSTSSNPLIAFVYDGASKPSAPRLIGKLGKNRYFKSLKVSDQGRAGAACTARRSATRPPDAVQT